MRQRDDFDPHRSDRVLLLVQGAIGPFGRLFKASRGEMRESDILGVGKGIWIKRAQAARPFAGFDRRLGLVAKRVDLSPCHPGVRRVWVERQGAIESRRRHRRLAGEDKQRPGSLPNRFGVIALRLECLSRQAAGFADVAIRQRPPPPNPLPPPAPADQSRGRRVGGIDHERLPGEDDRLGNASSLSGRIAPTRADKDRTR